MGKHNDPEIDAFFSKSPAQHRAEAKRRAEEFRGNPNMVLELTDAWYAWQNSIRRTAELVEDGSPEKIKQEFLVGKKAFERWTALTYAASKQDALAFMAATGWGTHEPPKEQ